MTTHDLYTFPVLAEPVTRRIQHLLAKRAPAVAANIISSPTNSRAFSQFCIDKTRIDAQSRIFASTERDAVSQFVHLLTVNFPKLVSDFVKRVRSIEDCAVTDLPDQSLSCPICLCDHCDSTLKCCRAPIHRSCNKLHQMNGFTQCSLCKRAFN